MLHAGVVAILTLLAGAASFPVHEAVPSRASHAPIVIDTDAGLLLPDAVSGNGVISGTGTSTDPYVIGGWSIAFTNAEPAITIRATTRHILLRDVEIHATEPPKDEGALQGPALVLQNAQNVRWERISIRDAWTGAWIEGSDLAATDTVLQQSTIEIDGADVRMTGLVATGGGPNGALFCRESCSLELADAEFALSRVDRGYGPRDYGGLVVVGDVELRDARFAGATDSSGVRGTGRVSWSSGSVEGRALEGELTATVQDVVIRRETIHSYPLIWTKGDLALRRVMFEGSAAPAIIAEGRSILIEDSRFKGHDGALKIENPSADVTVRRTAFEDVGGIILDNAVGASVDARWNSWDREPQDGVTIRGPMQVDPWEANKDVGRLNTPALPALAAIAALVFALIGRRR